MGDFGIGTPRRVLTGAAKEMLLEAMDKLVTEQVEAGDQDWELVDELVVQRNRVAKFLGLPTRKWTSDTV